MSNNFYDVKTQPTLYAAYEASTGDASINEVGALLTTIQRIDKMVDQLQRDFVEEICMATDDGKYIFSRGSILLTLENAVRFSAIRLEQIPADLRAEVEQMVHEAVRR